ncbi:MAG: FapA family protein [Lawsonibacter sp.]|nr:FapA family protein [Lawsonibacter sp.]
MEGSPQNGDGKNDISSELEHKESLPVDAIIQGSISNDGLKAFLKMEPPANGGAGPTLEAITDELAKKNITYQVDYKKLNILVANPIYHLGIPISSGLAPVDGVDGTATFLIRTQKSGVQLKTDEKGNVDYRDLDMVENVKRGQTLCQIVLPTEGTPGISVQGKELPQKKGKPVPSYLGRNTELNEDGTAILSKIDGQAEFNGQQINVEETFYVKGNVDNSTGNLQVNGNLSIRGMVLPGFVLEAVGKIEVEGTVVNATIKAGSDVKLHSGITGGMVHCGGDLACKYIENSQIFTVRNINAESIVNSDVKCGKSIIVSGQIAKIMGGSCIAGENIEAGCIGSWANIKTKLELGTDPTVIERQQKLLAHISDMETQNHKLNPLIAILQQLETNNRLTPEKNKALENARYTYETNVRSLELEKNELEEMAQSIKAKGFGQILCSKTIYVGAQIIIGDAYLNITDALNHVSLYYKDGEICVGTTIH